MEDASASRRHRFQSASYVDNSCRSVASTEARQGFVRVGAMEEREHAARGGAAEGKTLPMYAIFVDSQGLRYTIPHALAVTDGRV